MKRRTKTKQWHKKHVSDPWVQQARKEGFRSRSAYKLIEVHDAEQIFKPGQSVVDLGAAPGGWSQVAVESLKGRGTLVGIDLLPVDPLAGATFFQGDFRDANVHTQLMAAVGQDWVDVILCDMSPDLSGIRCADQARSIGLAEAVLAFACQSLAPDGTLLIKVFQGAGFDAFFAEFKRCFVSTKTKKPKASRDRSKETYLLGRGLRQAIS